MPKAAKEIVQRDRFVIRATGIEATVDEGLAGKMLSALTRWGINDATYEVVTDVHTFAQKKVYEVKAEDFMRAWMQDHPTFGAIEAVKHFREDGRTDGSAYTSLRTLVEKRELRKTSPGHYQRADVKAIEAGKHIARERHDVDHREFILRYARSHGGRASRQKLLAYFEQHGRKATSVGGALNVLIAGKMMKSLGEGEYLLLAKGGAKSPAKKTNGAEAPTPMIATTAEETAHG